MEEIISVNAVNANQDKKPEETNKDVYEQSVANTVSNAETSMVKQTSGIDLDKEIETVVKTIIELMGIRVQVKVSLMEDRYYVNVRSRSSDGLLIGKRGTTIQSIQAITNQIMKHRFPEVLDIFVDVAGYRMRRENFLKKKALAVAKIVSDTKREMALDILTERELRIVEKELAPLGTVKVYSIGSGSKRTVVIAPNV
ncbi:MAG: KH domain-containing protein [candidate division WOR-3 bacterium]|nr:KH domain-containing protein [candidate division WOR-3 bacterium]